MFFVTPPTPLAGTVYSIMQWDLESEPLGPLLASQCHISSRIQAWRESTRVESSSRKNNLRLSSFQVI